MATQAMGFAGRGRGRARNLSAALSKPGVGSQLNKSPESSSNLESESASLIDVEKPLVSCLKSPTQLHLEELLNQARSLVSNDETIGKLADLLCEKSMEDRDLATVSGEVVSSLTGLQTLGGTFRNRLLNKMQEYFKKRDELRNKNFDRFLGFVTLLCSLFKWLKVNDEPLKALAVPIYGLLEELLDGKSGSPDQRENEIETFHHCMFLVATLLEKCDKKRMDALFYKVRNTILKKASQKMRCLLLETLEYYASGNWTVKDEIKIYYCDLLSDIMAKG